MEFNQKFFNIIIIIILIFVLRKLFLTNVFENLSDGDEQEIRNLIQREYQTDIQAIKNLGNLSKRIMDTNGELVLPYNVRIRGNLQMEGNLEMKGNIAMHKNQIYFNTLTDHNHKIYYTISGNKVVLQSFNNVELNTTQDNGNINIKKPLNVDGGITGTSINAPGTSIIGPFRITSDAGKSYIQNNTDNHTIQFSGSPNNSWKLDSINFGEKSNINVSSGNGTFGNAKIGTAADNNNACFSHKDTFGNDSEYYNHNIFMNSEANHSMSAKFLYITRANDRPGLIFMPKHNSHRGSLYMENGYLQKASTKGAGFSSNWKIKTTSWWTDTLVKT